MYLEVSEGAQIGSVGEALVSIVDDGDAGVIEFKETKYSAVEGTTVAAVLERTSGGTSGTVDVLVSVHPNGGRNVQAGVRIVTFLDGARSATLDIPLENDSEYPRGGRLDSFEIRIIGFGRVVGGGGGGEEEEEEDAARFLTDSEAYRRWQAGGGEAAAFPPNLFWDVLLHEGVAAGALVAYGSLQHLQRIQYFSIPNTTAATTTTAAAKIIVAEVVAEDDGDAGVFAFAEVAVEIQEDAAFVDIVVLRTAGASGNVTVGLLFVLPGEKPTSGRGGGGVACDSEYEVEVAWPNLDYVYITSPELLFGDGVREQSLRVEIMNDGLLEYPSEELSVRIVSVSPGSGAVIGEKDAVKIFILDDVDGGYFDFDGDFKDALSWDRGKGRVKVVEDAGVVRVLIQRRGGMSSKMDVKLEFGELSSPLPEAITDEALQSITDVGQYISEHMLQSLVVTFADGETEKVVEIPLVDNDVFDADGRDMLVSIKEVSPGGKVGANGILHVWMKDDGDTGFVVFSEAVYMAREDAATVDVYLDRLGGTDKDLAVVLEVARYSGGDEVILDALLRVNHHLANATLAAERLTRFEEHVVVFQDRETSRVFRLEVSDDGTYAGDGVIFDLRIKEYGVVVSYSAVLDADQPHVTEVYTTEGGQEAMYYQNLVVEDVSALFRDGVFGKAAQEGRQRSSIVLLDDGDMGTFQFQVDPLTVIEGDASQIDASKMDVTISRTEGSSGVVNVTVEAISGSALFPMDLSSGLQVLTFQDGQLLGVASFSIYNDAIFEYPDETFSIRIKSVSGAAKVGTHDTVSVAISDFYDAGILKFETGSYEIGEDRGFVEVFVSRTHGFDAEVSVEVNTEEDSATSGSDFLAMACSVTLERGAAQASVFIPIVDDGHFEGTERFFVRLGKVVGGGRLGEQNITEIVIRDERDQAGCDVYTSESDCTGTAQGRQCCLWVESSTVGECRGVGSVDDDDVGSAKSFQHMICMVKLPNSDRVMSDLPRTCI